VSHGAWTRAEAEAQQDAVAVAQGASVRSRCAASPCPPLTFKHTSWNYRLGQHHPARNCLATESRSWHTRPGGSRQTRTRAFVPLSQPQSPRLQCIAMPLSRFRARKRSCQWCSASAHAMAGARAACRCSVAARQPRKAAYALAQGRSVVAGEVQSQRRGAGEGGDDQAM
jgi:hypothetical protein